MRPAPAAAALFLLLLCGSAVADEAPAEAPAAPTSPAASFESFQQAVQNAKDDPEQTAKLFVLALVARESDRALGDAQVSLLLRGRELMADTSSPSGWAPTRSAGDLLDKIGEDTVRGYCGGTAAEDYKNANLEACEPQLDKEYSSKAQGLNGEKAKYFVTNLGASRPRPIGLRIEAQRDGDPKRWLVDSYAGLLTGVAAPKSEWDKKD